MYRMLRAHPEVCVSTAKETLYFEAEYHRGPTWYARFFAHCTGVRAVGEVSNTYVFSPEAAERIHGYDSAMRIVSSLRDPVDRAFSHYLLMLRNAQVEGSFEEVIENQRPDLVSRGLYGRHLTPWFQRFPRERILILLFDELQADPKEFARCLFEFLGVAPYTKSNLEKKVLAASKPRSRLVSRLAQETAAVVRGMGFPELVTRVKEGVVPHLLYDQYDEGEKPRIKPATRAQLQEYYRDDLKRASELVGVDLVVRWFERGSSEAGGD